MAVVSIYAQITGKVRWMQVVEELANSALSSSVPSPDNTSLIRTGLAYIATYRNDAGLAGQQYRALKSLPGRMTEMCTSVDRTLGLLSQTMDNLDQAAAHFEEALAFCRKAGYRPELAWTCCDYADALLQRNNEGDRAKAVSLLEESLAISSELGMRPLMERVLSRREILKA